MNAGRKTAPIVRRMAALLLALTLLLSALPAQAASAVFASNNDADRVDVYVRAFVPTKYSPSNSIGHYDFMIKGVLRYRGKTFVNPVLSYRVDGTLDIFSEADTGKMYKHSSKSDYFYGCHIYRYHRSVSGMTSVNAFLRALDNSISSSHTHSNASGAIKCTLKRSATFAKYDVFQVNCFLAVATWMSKFGDSSLLKYYKRYHSGSGSNYMPATFVKHFSVSKVL